MREREKNTSSFFLACLLVCCILSSCSSLGQAYGKNVLLPTRAVVRTKAVLQKNVVLNNASHSCLNSALANSSLRQHSALTNVSIDTTCSIGVSQFATGITYNNATFDCPGGSDPAALTTAKSLLNNSAMYQSTPIMGWDAPDPWPDPTNPEPTNWGELDHRIQLAVAAGITPVITLAEAPWWMKGQLQSDGTTRALTRLDEWADIAYSSRILDNEMPAWLHLVQRIAERYMVAPYNVRYFQVWNELKGYYNPRLNTWDYKNDPGDPGGPNAKHGYTYMYNRVYATLMQVATRLNIAEGDVKIGGPYVFMDTWPSKDQSNPSNFVKAYGVYDQRSLDTVEYWLQHKIGGGFITVDASVENRGSGKVTPDPFTASEKFADITQWIRSLDNAVYPGAKTMPIWMAEWFASPRETITVPDMDYDNAIKAYAMIKFAKAGGAVALSWDNDGDDWTDMGLWSPTCAGGGQPRPWYFSYQAFKDNFAAGTKLYKTSVSAPGQVEALASDRKVMLVNKTAHALALSVNGTNITLTSYQVSVIDIPGK